MRATIPSLILTAAMAASLLTPAVQAVEPSSCADPISASFQEHTVHYIADPCAQGKTLIVSGYRENGQMVFLKMLPLDSETALEGSVDVGSDSYESRTFLLGTGTPVPQCGARKMFPKPYYDTALDQLLKLGVTKGNEKLENLPYGLKVAHLTADPLKDQITAKILNGVLNLGSILQALAPDPSNPSSIQINGKNEFADIVWAGEGKVRLDLNKAPVTYENILAVLADSGLHGDDGKPVTEATTLRELLGQSCSIHVQDKSGYLHTYTVHFDHDHVYADGAAGADGYPTYGTKCSICGKEAEDTKDEARYEVITDDILDRGTVKINEAITAKKYASMTYDQVTGHADVAVSSGAVSITTVYADIIEPLINGLNENSAYVSSIWAGSKANSLTLNGEPVDPFALRQFALGIGFQGFPTNLEALIGQSCEIHMVDRSGGDHVCTLRFLRAATAA